MEFVPAKMSRSAQFGTHSHTHSNNDPFMIGFAAKKIKWPVSMRASPRFIQIWKRVVMDWCDVRKLYTEGAKEQKNVGPLHKWVGWTTMFLQLVHTSRGWLKNIAGFLVRETKKCIICYRRLWNTLMDSINFHWNDFGVFCFIWYAFQVTFHVLSRF